MVDTERSLIVLYVSAGKWRVFVDPGWKSISHCFCFFVMAGDEYCVKGVASEVVRTLEI